LKRINIEHIIISNFYLHLFFKINLKKMKKILLFIAVALLGTTVTFAQTKTAKAKKTKAVKEVKMATPAVEGAGMKFETETIDYGTIQQNADGKRDFVFVNNGNKPLIITNATGSCGCTVPSFPKEPILPGQRAVIGVKYDTSKSGAISKTVTVTSNAEGMPSKVLNIKGTVNAAPAATVVPATKS
jgi:Protein of unknown function (DUF1573)